MQHLESRSMATPPVQSGATFCSELPPSPPFTPFILKAWVQSQVSLNGPILKGS